MPRLSASNCFSFRSESACEAVKGERIEEYMLSTLSVCSVTMERIRSQA